MSWAQLLPPGRDRSARHAIAETILPNPPCDEGKRSIRPSPIRALVLYLVTTSVYTLSMPREPSDAVGEEAARKLIPLAEAAELSGLSAGHLRLMVRRGRLWATKIGRNWVTTEEAIRTYLSLDRRPGPKPKR